MTRNPSSADAGIYNTLRNAIMSGALRAGDILDSTPVLTARFGIGYHTAQKALQRLALEGLILRKNGRATLVADVPGAAVRRVLNIGVYMPTMGLALTAEQSPMHYNFISHLLRASAEFDIKLPLFPKSDPPYDFTKFSLDGLIAFDPPDSGLAELELIRSSGLPMVLVEARGPKWNGFNRMLNDVRSGTGMAMKYLIGKGHRRITFCCPEELAEGNHTADMFHVYSDFMKDLDMPPQITDDFSALSGADAVLSCNSRYTAAIRMQTKVPIAEFDLLGLPPADSAVIRLLNSPDFSRHLLNFMLEVIRNPIAPVREMLEPMLLDRKADAR